MILGHGPWSKNHFEVQMPSQIFEAYFAQDILKWRLSSVDHTLLSNWIQRTGFLQKLYSTLRNDKHKLCYSLCIW